MSNQLEKWINKVNIKYRVKNEALILQVPTPIIPTKKGLIPKPSTVDYTGLLKGGRFIAFDAKQSAIKTRFDIKNIHDHQMNFLRKVNELGGHGFFLVHLYNVHEDKAWIIYPDVVTSWKQKRASIPIEGLEELPLVNINSYLDYFDEKPKNI